jgi:hypothetical protein
VPSYPFRQHRHQTTPTGIIGRLPNRSQPRQQGSRLVAQRPTRDNPWTALPRRRAQGADRRLAMIAQQFLGLIQQLPFVLHTGALITPPHLRQYLFPCPLTHGFVHSGHGNSHFWRNVSFSPALPPVPGNKTFGAIRGGQMAQYAA